MGLQQGTDHDHFCTPTRRRRPADRCRPGGHLAGPLAGFGYEITRLKRYPALAEQGTKWLLVQADDSEQAATVATAARSCGATMAVHYRTFTVEELIP